MPQAFYLVPVPDGSRPDQGLPPGFPGRPDQGLPPGFPERPDQGLPPWYGGRPDQGLPWGPGRPNQDLPWGPGRPDNSLPWGPGRPNQDLPWAPAYPGHGLPPAPVRPDQGLPGNGIPWWLLPFLIGPAGGVYSGVTEAGIPIHPEKPDPTKPGTWILVGVGPGDVRWAWAPTSEAPPTAQPK